MRPAYAELQATTHFSFLRGVSSPEDMFASASVLGLPALAVTDRNSLAGAVRAHAAAITTGVRFVLGCRLDLRDGASLLVYPTDHAAYSRLTRLLTLGKRRAGERRAGREGGLAGACDLGWEDLPGFSAGQVGVLLAEAPEDGLADGLGRMRDLFGDGAHLALTRRFRPQEPARLDRLAGLARAARVETLVTNDVLMHAEDRRVLQDVVTAIREGCTVEALGHRRVRTVGRWLKPPDEMARLFPGHADAVARTLEVAGRCMFSLADLTYEYPREAEGESPQAALERLTYAGAAARYPAGTPPKVEAQLRHELALIGRLGYAPYFLTVAAIVRFARSQGILCQGRGSAANSAVCYVLGVTAIDPGRHDLLFERFVSAERREPPDIDVDFEHERREEVIQWIYATYGRDRAALAATVVRYRARGALRDVGKALGLPADVTGALARLTWAWDADGAGPAHVRQLNLNTDDRRLALALDLARQLMGTPRHLGQHPGGFVLTLHRLDDFVPVVPAAMADRQMIEWDKDDLDAAGMMKVDVLGLGMLGCLRRVFDALRDAKGIALDLASVPQDDPAVYDMICRADTIGVFQIESRAQMSMLPRLRPRSLDDLTIEVAVVRPGPIQGDMVHPYLRRRQGKEPVVYPTPELRKVLEKTLGVPLFQEQAMSVAIVCAGFSPGKADALRRAMATFKVTGGVTHFRDELVGGMVRNGYAPDFAEAMVRQLEGFGAYGFPMSHAASFAILAYASSWVKHHHPDVFLLALLNSQPMGFYPAAQLVADARRHGVEVRPVDVNHSRWDCTLEGEGAGPRPVRLGLRLVAGLADAEAARLVGARDLPYDSVADLNRRARLKVGALAHLAEADAYGSLGLGRRDAMWAIRALRDAPLPLFEAADAQAGQVAPEMPEPPLHLKPMAPGRAVVDDYAALGLSLKAHPLSFLRGALGRRRVLAAGELAALRDGSPVRVAGLVLVRQRPGSAKGVMFITLEDETGPVNVIVWPTLFERFRRTVLSAGLMGVEGRLQREGLVVHVVASRLVDLSGALARLGGRDALTLPHGRGDEARGGGGPDPRALADALKLSPRLDRVPRGGLRLTPRNFR